MNEPLSITCKYYALTKMFMIKNVSEEIPKLPSKWEVYLRYFLKTDTRWWLKERECDDYFRVDKWNQ